MSATSVAEAEEHEMPACEKCRHFRFQPSWPFMAFVCMKPEYAKSCVISGSKSVPIDAIDARYGGPCGLRAAGWEPKPPRGRTPFERLIALVAGAKPEKEPTP